MQPVISGPRTEFTEEEVLDTLAYQGGGLVRHGIRLFDSDGELLSPQPAINVEGGEVQYSYSIPDSLTGGGNSFAPVQRTAVLTVTGDLPEGFNILATRFQPYVELMSPLNNWIRFYAGMFVATMPPVSYDGIVVRRELELADLSHMWARSLLTNPVAVPAGTVVTTWVRDSLSTRFDVPTVTGIIASAKTLGDSLVFEPGTSWLEIYNTLLSHIGWEPLGTTVSGAPQSRNANLFKDKAIEWTYGQGGTLVAAGNIEPVDPELPNVLKFISTTAPSLAAEGNGWRTAKNLADGPGSIFERGTEVSRQVEVEAKTQTELDDIAEFQSVRIFAGGGLRYSGQVALNPLHEERDIVNLNKPSMGITSETDKWVVTSWTLPMRPVLSVDDVLMNITMERFVTATLGE